MAESMANGIEDTVSELGAFIIKLRRYALLPEKEQTAFSSESDAHYVPQKLADIAKLIGEVNAFLNDKLPSADADKKAADGLHTPVRGKRLLVCPNAPQRKRLRGCVESLAKALVEYEQSDESI